VGGPALAAQGEILRKYATNMRASDLAGDCRAVANGSAAGFGDRGRNSKHQLSVYVLFSFLSSALVASSITSHHRKFNKGEIARLTVIPRDRDKGEQGGSGTRGFRIIAPATGIPTPWLGPSINQKFAITVNVTAMELPDRWSA
jgi:hypothetical protein